MKVIAISGDKKWYRIGESYANAQWYSSEKVIDIPIDKGDLIEFTDEKDKDNKNILTSIKKVGENRETTSSDNSRYRNPEEMTRAEVGHMVSRTMIMFQGTLDSTNVDEVKKIIKDLYLTYTTLVTNG